MGEQGKHLAGLIERLKRASGPDRELDLEIGNFAGNLDAMNFVGVRRPEYAIPEHVPHYTSSIDAAMTLANGWNRLVRDHNGVAGYDGEGKNAHGFASLYVNKGGPIFTAYASTPALALCAVALEARAAIAKAEAV